MAVGQRYRLIISMMRREAALEVIRYLNTAGWIFIEQGWKGKVFEALVMKLNSDPLPDLFENSSIVQLQPIDEDPNE